MFPALSTPPRRAAVGLEHERVLPDPGLAVVHDVYPVRSHEQEPLHLAGAALRRSDAAEDGDPERPHSRRQLHAPRHRRRPRRPDGRRARRRDDPGSLRGGSNTGGGSSTGGTGGTGSTGGNGFSGGTYDPPLPTPPGSDTPVPSGGETPVPSRGDMPVTGGGDAPGAGATPFGPGTAEPGAGETLGGADPAPNARGAIVDARTGAESAQPAGGGLEGRKLAGLLLLLAALALAVAGIAWKGRHTIFAPPNRTRASAPSRGK